MDVGGLARAPADVSRQPADVSRQPADVEIREMEPVERALVIDSWWRGCMRRREERTRIGLFRRHVEGKIEELLRTATVSVATPVNMPDEVISWLCFSDLGGCRVLHYCHTKHHMRGFRVASTLIDAAVSGWDRVAFSTLPLSSVARRLLRPSWEYNPFAGVGV